MAIYYVAGIPYGQTDELYHFGRKGMKWGQNIFTKFSQFAARQGWKGLSTAAAKASSGLRKANEYINRDQAKANFENAQRRYIANPNQMTLNALNAAKSAYNNSGLAGDMARLNQQRAQAMQKARELATSAYSEAAKAAGNAGKNIHAFYSDVMTKATAQINRGQALVRKYGGEAVNSIKNLGDRALSGGKSFLDGILNRFRKKEADVSPVTMKERRNAQNHAKSVTAKDVNYTNRHTASMKERSVKSANEASKKKKKQNKQIRANNRFNYQYDSGRLSDRA